MTRRYIMGAVAVLLVVASLSALVAYRFGLHHGYSRARPVGPTHDCVDFEKAGEHLGEETCVTGRVLRAFTSKSGNTFLDFCADYRNCPFTSVIFASDRSKFGDLESLGGRSVELRGKIDSYRGQPEIVVREPDQIREAP